MSTVARKSIPVVVVLLFAILCTAIAALVLTVMGQDQQSNQNHTLLQHVNTEQMRVDHDIRAAGATASIALAKGQSQILADLSVLCAHDGVSCPQ